MEFEFNLESILKCENNMSIIIPIFNYENPLTQYCINIIIDKIGQLSARANKLRYPITTSSKFYSSNNKIIILCKTNIVLGFLKYGVKTLYLKRFKNDFQQYNVLSVLEFYVDERFQRRGYGKKIFDKLLEIEKTFPWKLAFDSPTTALFQFLNKNYHIHIYSQQPNNFVIFQNFFEGSSGYLATNTNNSPDQEEKRLQSQMMNLGQSIMDFLILRVIRREY